MDLMRWRALALPALLALAAAVRLPTLTAGLPYMTYVDEGHVVHRSLHLLAKRTWEPDTYSYGSLPFYLVAGSALAWSPFYAARHGHPLADDLSPDPPRHYGVVAPVDLLVAARLVTLAFSLGVVALTGLLARRLGGLAPGLLAAWLAALVPALVARSAIVNINPLVAFFALAALLFAEGARDGRHSRHSRRDAALAGAMTGLAAATKYPAALVCLPVALAILLAEAPWRERLRRLLLAGVTAAAALLAAMPALVLRPGKVLAAVREMSEVYGTQEIGSYWDQAVHRAEWDLPLRHPEVGIAFLTLAAAGLAVALRDRRWSPPAWGWMVFAAATGLLVAPYKFRAFRNLLALVPLAAVLIALLYAAARRRLASPLALRSLDLAAALLPVILFAPALDPYVRYQLGLEDTRERALHWLAAQAPPGGRILFSEELAFLPQRIASLPNETAVRPWGRAWGRILDRRFQYLVLGDIRRTDGQPRIGQPERAWILQNYRLEKTFGSVPTYPVGYPGNRQTLYILKRMPRPDVKAP
jgi:DNA-binding transcriptional ArsR family regulator